MREKWKRRSQLERLQAEMWELWDRAEAMEGKRPDVAFRLWEMFERMEERERVLLREVDKEERQHDLPLRQNA